MYTKSSWKTAWHVALILIGLATAGCERLGTPHTSKQLGIPAALGDLVAITPDADPTHQVLWFKQSDQTIVAVRVSVPRGTIEAEMTKFARN